MTDDAETSTKLAGVDAAETWPIPDISNSTPSPVVSPDEPVENGKDVSKNYRLILEGDRHVVVSLFRGLIYVCIR